MTEQVHLRVGKGWSVKYEPPDASHALLLGESIWEVYGEYKEVYKEELTQWRNGAVL